MSRLISDILQANEPDFSKKIAYFEELAGNPGLDLKLVSDMIQQHKIIANNLGLDGSDTTVRELFFCLNKKALEDSELLETKVGIGIGDGPAEVVEKCIKHISTIYKKNKAWSKKTSVSRKELKNNPPKKLMKIFGLRSVDSALKRESMLALEIFAKITEPKSWLLKHVANGLKLKNSDFDYKEIEISAMNILRQQQFAKTGFSLNQVVYVDQENAGILIMVPAKRFRGDALFLINSMIENINKLIINSLFIKKKSLEPNFSDILSLSRKRGFNNLANDYLGVGWIAYSKSQAQSQIEGGIDEFDISLGDEISDLSIADVIGENFWTHNFVLKTEDNIIVSCNLSDVLLNAINQHEPENSHIGYGQSELSSELFGRYLAHQNVIKYLDREHNDNANIRQYG